MSTHHPLHIIALVGLAGSGKTTAAEYLSRHGYPNVHASHSDAVIEQIQGLEHAGQRTVVLDGIDSWDSYRQLRHAFPGEMTLIALLASRHTRHHRLSLRADEPQTEPLSQERDMLEIETRNLGGVIMMHEYLLHNEGAVEELYESLDEIVESLDR